MAGYGFQPQAGANDIQVADLGFSFVAAGASTDPSTDLTRGKLVSTITFSSTGKYIVTLDRGFQQINAMTASVEADSSGDGAYATAYVPDAAANPLVLHVFTHAAGGTLTNLTSRRVSVRIAMKLSSAT
jgi:hypothetical protein